MLVAAVACGPPQASPLGIELDPAVIEKKLIGFAQGASQLTAVTLMDTIFRTLENVEIIGSEEMDAAVARCGRFRVDSPVAWPLRPRSSRLRHLLGVACLR